MQITFESLIGALIGLGALGAVGYAAVVQGNASAAGALVAVVSAATGFFLRAKIQPPTTQVPDPPIVPHG